MPITGGDLVAKNIIKYGQGFIKTVNTVMKSAEFLIDREVTKNISLDDHSLEDLRKLGHPYSLKNGGNLHTPSFQVHKQSGKLLESKQSGTVDADVSGGTLKASAYVLLDKDIAPQALFVVYGTSKMVPRPVMSGSRDAIAPEVLKMIKNTLKDLKVSLT